MRKEILQLSGRSLAARPLPLAEPTSGNDVLNGTAGDDVIDGLAGNDILRGFAGNDDLRGGDGNDTLNGFAGIDTLTGGRGNDTYHVTDGDTIIENSGEGVDTVYSSVDGFVLPDNVENLWALGGLQASGNDLANIIWGSNVADTPLNGAGGNDTIYGYDGGDALFGDAGEDFLFGGGGADQLEGGADADSLYGGFGDDTLDGGDGADRLFGAGGWDALVGGADNDLLDGGLARDTLNGGAGADVLIGGDGNDTLTGGLDADRFVFRTSDLADPRWRDFITDFNTAEGDRIDLSAIDAVAGGVNNAFTFLGDDAFNGVAGELRYFYSGPEATTIQVDINGDGVADLTILLFGQNKLVAEDFVL